MVGFGEGVDAVVVGDLHDVELFKFIGTAAVVEDDIDDDADAVLLEGSAGVEELFPRTVFGGHGVFLIKLAEVEEIINIIAGAGSAACALAGGGEPCGGDAEAG